MRRLVDRLRGWLTRDVERLKVLAAQQVQIADALNTLECDMRATLATVERLMARVKEEESDG